MQPSNLRRDQNNIRSQRRLSGDDDLLWCLDEEDVFSLCLFFPSFSLKGVSTRWEMEQSMEGEDYVCWK